MNSKSTFTLSEYQHGILHELGISSWRQNIPPAPDIKPESSAKADQEDNGSTVMDKSLPEHVLFCTSLAEHPIFSDVLLALGLQDKPRKGIVEGDFRQYSDYALAWQVADTIALHGTELTTLELSCLTSAEAKKQLWQAVQDFESHNRAG